MQIATNTRKRNYFPFSDKDYKYTEISIPSSSQLNKKWPQNDGGDGIDPEIQPSIPINPGIAPAVMSAFS